jgi:hypothetical protein
VRERPSSAKGVGPWGRIMVDSWPPGLRSTTGPRWWRGSRWDSAHSGQWASRYAVFMHRVHRAPGCGFPFGPWRRVSRKWRRPIGKLAGGSCGSLQSLRLAPGYSSRDGEAFGGDGAARRLGLAEEAARQRKGGFRTKGLGFDLERKAGPWGLG